MSHVIEVTVDEQGRILLSPHAIRTLGLTPGMTLVVEEASEGSAFLSATEESCLVDEDGLLVFHGEMTEAPPDLVRRERERRVDDLIERIGL